MAIDYLRVETIDHTLLESLINDKVGEFLSRQEVQPPIVIMLSVIGVRGYPMALDNR